MLWERVPLIREQILGADWLTVTLNSVLYGLPRQVIG